MNVTLAKVGYALLKTTSTGEISYDDITWFKSDEAGGRNVGAEPKGELKTIHADGLPIVVANENSGYDISLELISIVDSIEADWFGNTKTSDGGILEKGGVTTPPRFALITAKECYDRPTRYEIDTYYDCSAARAARNDKTTEGAFDPQFPTFKITAVPRPDNKYVRYTNYADALPTAVTTPVEANPTPAKTTSTSGTES